MDETLDAVNSFDTFRRQMEPVHPSLATGWPLAIAEGESAVVYLPDEQAGGYQAGPKAAMPAAAPAGIRAAFPLEEIGDRAACVVTADALHSRAGWVDIMHEFVHCWQWAHGEPKLRASLEIERDTRKQGKMTWELDHPFPYEDEAFGHAYRKLLTALADGDDTAIHTAHAALRQVLSTVDHEYMTWQHWKEGLARWVENMVREVAELPPRCTGEEAPWSRVSFYASGSRLIAWLQRTEPGIVEKPQLLFQRLYSLRSDDSEL